MVYNGQQKTETVKLQSHGSFDWLSYNLNIASRQFGEGNDRLAIAIDHSYMRNAKNNSSDDCPFGPVPDPNRFEGLEVLGIGLVNADSRKCMMLRAVPALQECELAHRELSQPEWYLTNLWKYKEEFQKLTDTVVADAGFSTRLFVDGLQKIGFHLVSCLKNETPLSYLYDGPATGMRGRPKKYDGIIDFSALDKAKVRMLCIPPTEGKAFEMSAWSTTLERNIKLVAHYLPKGTLYIYFSTDESMRGIDVYDFYRSRFLMESSFRATTQLNRIPDTTSNSNDVMVFPHNASFSALNILRMVANQTKSEDQQSKPIPETKQHKSIPEVKQSQELSPRIRP